MLYVLLADSYEDDASCNVQAANWTGNPNVHIMAVLVLGMLCDVLPCLCNSKCYIQFSKKKILNKDSLACPSGGTYKGFV